MSDIKPDVATADANLESNENPEINVVSAMLSPQQEVTCYIFNICQLSRLLWF